MRVTRIAAALIAVTTVLAGICSPGQAAGRPGPVEAVAPLVREDVIAWLDGYFPTLMQKGAVPGAVVVVVKDGRILAQKGYGYGNLARRTPADPDRSVFRVGSVSKLFVWTAVMQQVEQGKIDLDRDINDYLDFKIEPTFGKPITMRHLMTHTGGFADTMRGAGPLPDVPLMKLGDYLKLRLPNRIFAPGTMPGYSNYGTSLAGYIVERVSGEPFAVYAQRHIFAPLGMRRSTFQQPLPAQLHAAQALGYKTGSKSPWYFERINPSPAGALSSTGTDMARFMIAHLQQGRLGEHRIMRPETAAAMQTYNYSTVPPLNGMALGFWRLTINGQSLIGHGGATAVYRSEMMLYPEHGVGVFVARNSPGEGPAAGLEDEFVIAFTKRYFPDRSPPQEPTARDAKVQARKIAGAYEPSRRLDRSFLSLPTVLGRMAVRPLPDGTIEFGGLGQPKIFRAIGPLLWREVNGNDRLAAHMEGNRVVAIRNEAFPAMVALTPLPWWRNGALHVPLVVAAATVLLIALIAWPIAALMRRRYGIAWSLKGREARAYRFARLGAMFQLCFLVGWIWLVMTIWNDIAYIGDVIVPWVRLLQFIGLLGLVGAAFAISNAWFAWRGRDWWSRLGSTALALASLQIFLFGVAMSLFAPSLRF